MTDEKQASASRVPDEFPGGDAALGDRLNVLDKLPRPPAAAETLKYKVELITPLFGGGVKPGENDSELPVRMKALRGQLRFWWRLLAAYGGLKDCGFGPPADGLALYAEETARWGGAGENGKPIPGRIGLRALNPHGFDNPVKFEERDVDAGKYGTAPQFREPTRAIDYALFPAKRGERAGNDARTLILPKEWVGQNEDVSCFTLEISVNAGDAPKASQIAEELRCAVAWWATFGGIGARWRRGAGSVRVRDENNNLLCVLDDFPTNDPSRPAWIYGMQLRTRPDCNVAKDAWAQAVWPLRAFRQDPKPGIGRGGSLESSPKVFKQSYWPEPHLARHHHGPTVKWAHDTEARFCNGGAAGYVARGAFGLPLGIKFPPKFPSPRYRLQLTLADEGRNLVIVTLVDTSLHIRIFDGKGRRVVDKRENELVNGEEVKALKRQIKSMPSKSRPSKDAEQKIIEEATLVSGHAEPPETKFLPIGSNRVASNRMASPLILRAVARRNGTTFTPCALLLPWWRDALRVPLAADLGGSTSPTAGYRVWPDDPAARRAAAAEITPIKNRPAGTTDPDPLSAFMEFFSK